MLWGRPQSGVHTRGAGVDGIALARGALQEGFTKKALSNTEIKEWVGVSQQKT